MQRGVGSMRATARGTHFVSPAGNGRGAHPLARGHAGMPARIPRSLALAVQEDPLGALRRAARSLTTDRPAGHATSATIRPSSLRWASARRDLTPRRSWGARPRSG